MKEEKSFIDKELGKIIIRTNARSRHIVLRTRPEGILVTIPEGCTMDMLQEVIEKYRQKLLLNKKKTDSRNIDLNFAIDSEFFKLTLITGTHPKFLAHSKLGYMQIACPPTARFEDEELQNWLRKVIEEAMRKNAKAILPVRLEKLSKQYNLPFHSVKINASKGRWGSCSTRKDINLSFYLILLPSHLIDYVLLHELTHTLEMNHGEKFWALMDKVTGGKSLRLRDELKKYQTQF